MSYNFTTVMGKSEFKAWKNWAVGDYLVGKFISEGEDKFGNPSYKVEVVEASFEDGTKLAPKSIFSLNSSGTLKKAMDSIEVGDIIKVIFRGKETLTTGKYKGKEFNSMEVLVAKDGGQATAVETSDDDLI